MPIFIDQAIYAMKYVYHLKLSTQNRMLNQFHLNATKLSVDKALEFANAIHKIMGISAPFHMKQAERNIFRIKKYLHREFQTYWRQMINTPHAKGKKGNNKLRNYKEYKSAFNRESYLEINDPSLRKNIAQLRLSAHKLNIESGRYNARNQYIPPADRICRNCTLNVTEDEMHFVLKCAAYENLRADLLKQCVADNAHFSSYNFHQKFIWIMSNENLDNQKSLGKYIYAALKVRK